MRRITVIVVAGLLLAAGCSGDDGDEPPEDGAATTTTAPAEAAAPTDDGPTMDPLVSGQGAVVDGTFVWTDYVYDDRGPNEDGEPGGDATYGDGWRNEGDLVQTQIGVDDEGRITVRAVLETLTDPSLPVVVVAFDTDQDADSGANGIGMWMPAEPIGAEQTAWLRQDEAVLDDNDGTPEELDVTVDPDENVIEATLPLKPGDETWNVLVAVATAIPDHEAGGVLFHDLGLVGNEREYRWQDDVQADLLAGEGSIADAVQEVPFQILADTPDQAVEADTPGFHTYLYESELDLGESVAPDAEEEDGLEYRGPYQPYLVYVPDDGVEEGEPMTLFLHGLTQNHLGSVITPDGTHIGTGRPLSEEIDDLAQYAVDGLDFPPHNLTVWPLARGEGLRYRGIAEQDVMDVLDDATERFAPDPDRIILSGASMGGIGTFRIGALYPDRFSVAAPIIGLVTEDTVPLLTNLWNVPIRQINGTADPLIPADAAAATTDELDRLELQYRAWMIDDRGHEAGGFVYDCVYASLPEFERVTEPADVYYAIDTDQFATDRASGLDLTYDGAYWVDGMVVADPGRLGAVEGHRIEGDGGMTEPNHVDRRGESGPDGGDLCGPNPDFSTGDTWRERAVERELIPAGVPQDPQVQVELVNLSAVTIDVEGVGLGSGNEVRLTSDTAAEVTLTGLEPGTVVTSGSEELTADDDGEVTFAAPEGETTVAF